MDFSPALFAAIGIVLVTGLVIALTRRSKGAPALPMSDPKSLRTEQATSQATVVARDLSLPAQYEKKLARLLKDQGGNDARCQLPALPPFFTGRRGELARALALLDSSQPPGTFAITTARELGGVGRTAFAAVLGHLLAERFPDGQLSIDLRGDDPVEHPHDVAEAMRSVIRMLNPDVPFPKDLADLPALYGKALEGRRVLVLVENVRPQPYLELLRPPAGSLLLLTSREPLAFAAIDTIAIEPLSRPDARAFLRACAARGSRVTDKSLDILAELSGYLPAALRLNAGRLQTNPSEKFESHCEQLKNADAIHEPIDAALQVSFAALPETSQRVWLRLASIPDSFDAGDAAAVCETAERPTRRLLDDLNAAGMLRVAQREPLRFAVHEAARAFARQMPVPADHDPEIGTARLSAHRASQPDESSRQKIADSWKAKRAFVQRFQSRSESDFSLTDLPPAFADPSRGPAPDYADALRFLADFPDTGSAFIHQTAWLEAAFSAARALGDRAAEIRALALLGKARASCGEPRLAVVCFEQWVEMARASADRHAEAEALGWLGVGWTETGFADRGTGCFEAQLRIAREIGDRGGEVHALGKLGEAKSILGEFQGAAALHDEQLRIARETGDRAAEVDAMEKLGVAWTRMKDLEKAAHFHAEQLAAARASHNHLAESRALGYLGQASLHRGKIEEAIAHYEAQLAVAIRIGNTADQSQAHSSLGVAWARQGDLRKAVAHYGQQLQIAQEIRNRLGEATAHSNIGSGLERLGDPAGAAAAWEQALAIYESLGSPSADTMRRWLERVRKTLADTNAQS